MQKTMVTMIITLLLLVACSSNENETNVNKNNYDHNEIELDYEDENLASNEENTAEEEENEAFPQGEVVFSEFEENPIPVEELDDKNMIKIDDEEISGLAIVYGEGELVSIFLNHTYRYNVETKEEIWQARNWGSPSQMFSLKDGILHYRGFSNIKGNVTTGEIEEKIDFDEETGYENYVAYNGPYRIGLTRNGVQVTNEETGKTVKLGEARDDYIETALMESVAATELDNIVTTYDNETGETLAEKEFPGDTVIFGRDGTDDLYAVFKPVENQYGYTFVLLDGKTLEEKAEYFVNNANGGLFAANDHVFYHDPVEEMIVALDGDLTEERYRMEVGGLSEHEPFYAYEDFIYFIDSDPEDKSVQNLIQFDAATGDVEQYIQFPHLKIREFYVLDGKIYAQFDGTEAEYLYYVIDKEDVHRSMD